MNQKPIQLKFNCNQDWNAMKATSCGRFCTVCNKEVIDFTGKSGREVRSLIAQTGDLCGRFTPGQLDPLLIAPIFVSFHRKVLLFISAAALAFLTKPAHAQSSDIKTASVIISPPVPATEQPSPEKPEQELQQEKPFPALVHPPFIKTKKRRYYWSKRFPFIVVRRNHTATLMGCPSF